MDGVHNVVENNEQKQSGWTDDYATDQGSYGYDAAGNLASDSRKGLLFSYNLANLPSKVDGVGYNAGLTLIQCLMNKLTPLYRK